MKRLITILFSAGMAASIVLADLLPDRPSPTKIIIPIVIFGVIAISAFFLIRMIIKKIRKSKQVKQ